MFLCSRSNVIVYKEKEKLEHPERNLSEKRRLNPAQQTPYPNIESMPDSNAGHIVVSRASASLRSKRFRAV